MLSDSDFDLVGKRVWGAGHRGMVGAALVRRLERDNCEVLAAMSSELDLRDQATARDWVARHKPDAVFIAAAKVGGILANNTYPADFLCDNLIIEANVTEASLRVGVGNPLFLGSSCIYPKFAPQPITETALLTGPLDPTNEWHAIAKVWGIKMCQAYRRQHGVDFIFAMPANVYGPGDNFGLNSSHVILALMRKIHDAKVTNSPGVVMWGMGTPRSEFLHCDDCADELVHLMKVYSDESHINVGSGKDTTIRELADRLLGPGCPPRIALHEGLSSTYLWYLDNAAVAAAVAV